MQKAEVQLVALGELLINDKAAEGKSRETLLWYAGGIRRYAEWLEWQPLEATLRHFTLDLVRRYIVDLQRQPANAFHPRVPTSSHPLSDQSINGYVPRAARLLQLALRRGLHPAAAARASQSAALRQEDAGDPLR